MDPLLIDNKPVQQHASPNVAERPTGMEPTLLVLHSTDGDFAGALAWLCNPASEVSSHYLVSRTGEIAQLVPTARIAWHAGKSSWHGREVRGSVNAFSIGIEMEHLDGQQDWPETQLAVTAALCRVLMASYRIPPAMVVAHAEVAPGRKVDPKDFPWPAFRARLIAVPSTPALEVANRRVSGQLLRDTLYLPARDACAALGATLAYTGHDTAEITCGACHGTLSGYLVNATLYLPARALCDLLKRTTTWEPDRQVLKVGE